MSVGSLGKFQEGTAIPRGARLGKNMTCKHRAGLIPQFRIGLLLLGGTNAGEERTSDDSEESHAALPDALWLGLAGTGRIWWSDRHRLV